MNKSGLCVLFVLGILYFPLIFFGFGSDTDLRLLVDALSRMWETGFYIPNRNPGYPVYEGFATIVLGLTQSAIALNFCNLLLMLASVFVFGKIWTKLDLSHTWGWMLVFGTSPFMAIHGTSSMDYMMAFFLILMGFWALISYETGRTFLLFVTVVSWSLAIGCRFASFFVPLALLGVGLCGRYPKSWPGYRVVGSALFFGFAWYLLPFWAWEGSFAFLQSQMSDVWPVWAYPVRWVYKSIYFLGPITSLGIAWVIFRQRRIFLKAWTDTHSASYVFRFSVLLIGLFLALYLRYPFEKAYLLPAWPFLLFVLGYLSQKRLVLPAFLWATQLFYGWGYDIQLMKPDVPNRARHASVGVYICPGMVRADISERQALMTEPLFAPYLR